MEEVTKAYPVPPQGKSEIEYLRVCVRAPPPLTPSRGSRYILQIKKKLSTNITLIIVSQPPEKDQYYKTSFPLGRLG